MPVDEVGIAGVVDHLDGDGLAFPQAQCRTRNRAIVCGGFDHLARGDLKRDRGDAYRVIDRYRTLGQSLVRPPSKGRHSHHASAVQNSAAAQWNFERLLMVFGVMHSSLACLSSENSGDVERRRTGWHKLLLRVADLENVNIKFSWGARDDDANRDSVGERALAARAGGGACEALPAALQDHDHAGDVRHDGDGVRVLSLHEHDHAHVARPDAAIGPRP